MKLLKSKKSEEGAAGMTWSFIIGLVICAALIIFVALWYTGLLGYGANLIKSAFRSLFG